MPAVLWSDKALKVEFAADPGYPFMPLPPFDPTRLRTSLRRCTFRAGGIGCAKPEGHEDGRHPDDYESVL